VTVKMMRYGLLLVALAGALLVVMPVAAKGAPFKMTIAGPGIKGEIEITDPSVLEHFGFYMFNSLERRIEAPAVEPGEGYRITRYADTERPWDYLTYTPNPDGGLGYLFFDGLDPSIGSTQGQGEWYLPSEDGDAAMKEILAGVVAGAAGERQAASQGSATMPVVVAVATLAILLGGAALLARRGQAPQAPASSKAAS
jgi:hypothetical protein